MSDFNLADVRAALDNINIENAFIRGGDLALLIDGEAVKASVVGRVDETPYDILDTVYYYDVWVVFKIGDRYFKRFGEWQSHTGRVWNGKTVEVKAKTKVVEYYE